MHKIKALHELGFKVGHFVNLFIRRRLEVDNKTNSSDSQLTFLSKFDFNLFIYLFVIGALNLNSFDLK